jgi:GNAT superfamily N-acetyltransferase
MTQQQLSVRSPSAADLSEMAALLTAENFGDDSVQRLRTAFDQLQEFSLLAARANRLEGLLLATFDGWHVFAGHLVVAASARGEGVGRLLIEALVGHAAKAGAKGVIVDARLSAVGFFQKLNFRLPGAVFLIRDVEKS